MDPHNKKINAIAKDFPEGSELTSESWRVFRIMTEFVEGAERLNSIQPAVSIFGSARTDANHPYYKLAEQIARKLSDVGFSVISGGGNGLNIQLPYEQYANIYQDVSQTFRHFFARKYMFVRFATAYVIMPGGFGTLDELMEALTLIQTSKIKRMPIILVCSTFWNGMLDWFRQSLIAENMISPKDMDLIQIIDDPDEIVNVILRYYETSNLGLPGIKSKPELNL